MLTLGNSRKYRKQAGVLRAEKKALEARCEEQSAFINTLQNRLENALLENRMMRKCCESRQLCCSEPVNDDFKVGGTG